MSAILCTRFAREAPPPDLPSIPGLEKLEDLLL